MKGAAQPPLPEVGFAVGGTRVQVAVWILAEHQAAIAHHSLAGATDPIF